MDALTFETLLALERAGWDALCTSRGADFYGRLMTPGAVMLLLNGMVLDRDAVVDSLSQAPAWDSYTLTDERFVPIGADSAALVYRATAQRGGTEPVKAVMSSTYALVNGSARLALYQQTALAT